MSNIALICRNKRLARLLELELSSADTLIYTVTDTLLPAELYRQIERAELVIYDADYYPSDMSFVETTPLPFAVFSKTPIYNTPKNVIAFFERPFDMKFFTERIKTLVITSEMLTVLPSNAQDDNNIRLDPFSKQAFIGEHTVKFSPREFDLFSFLYQNRGKTVLREDVLKAVWGENYDGKNNVDNVYINYIRKKLDEPLGKKIIYTVRGKGYMMK